MLINKIMQYCDTEYQESRAHSQCSNCNHKEHCSGGCKQCLEEIHYPSRYTNGKKFYDCPNLINFYVCDYTYKYATEIFYLLQTSSTLKQISNYRIFSVGCGGCPDLMAFEAYINKNHLNKTIEYIGIDKNEYWTPVHQKIEKYTTDKKIDVNLCIEDAFDFFEHYFVADINVLVIQYLVSAIQVAEGKDAVNILFDLLIDNVIKHRNPRNPFVILINDVNSINLGRDVFMKLPERLSKAGIHGKFTQYYFDRNIHHESQRCGNKHESDEAMPLEIASKYAYYEPWRYCTSAQLLIEIGGEK